MSDDPLLDTQIHPEHQALSARLTLAAVDHDADRTAAGLSEVVAGGMSTALAVIALLTRHLAITMVGRHGAPRRPGRCWRRRSSTPVRPRNDSRMTAQALPPSEGPPPPSNLTRGRRSSRQAALSSVRYRYKVARLTQGTWQCPYRCARRPSSAWRWHVLSVVELAGSPGLGAVCAG